MQTKTLYKVVLVALCLSLLVVMLGAYTRLTDAGLGCPDWPGCYGKIMLPFASKQAWTEMVHRYAAGSLAILIFVIGITVIYKRMQGVHLPWHIPVALLALVLFQAALGMWTVTLKLLPVVVMGHLLGGLLIVACLGRFSLEMSSVSGADLPEYRPWLRLALLIVFVQIALGGWVSSNYAGIACIGFPLCNGNWWPQLHLADAFNVFSSIGENYQGGLLDNEVRVTIQFVHRLGAIVTALYLLLLTVIIIRKADYQPLRIIAGLILFLVLIQCTLGIFNVVYLLPLPVAVAHNGVAALLLASVFAALHFTRRRNIHVLA